MLDSHKNMSIGLQCKSVGWFLYECNCDMTWLNKIKYYFLLGMIHSVRTQSSPKN